MEEGGEKLPSRAALRRTTLGTQAAALFRKNVTYQVPATFTSLKELLSPPPQETWTHQSKCHVTGIQHGANLCVTCNPILRLTYL